MTDACQTVLTENIKINKWVDGAQAIGCFEYCGFYYINMITGNTDRPDLGVGTGSYKGGFDFCGLVTQIAKMQIPDSSGAVLPCPTTPAVSEDQKRVNEFVTSFMGFIQGITEYELGAEYACNDWVIFDGALNKSLIDENTRHPHDKESWKSYGGIADILTVMFDEQSGYQVTLPYYEACGDGCVMPYGMGACAVVKTPAKDQLGNSVLDGCGNPVFDELIHVSLVDDNITEPVSGSMAEPPTWTSGMTACEFFNRSVGADENGNEIKPGSDACLVSCDAPMSPMKWVYADTDGNEVAIADGEEVPEGVTKRLTVEIPPPVTYTWAETNPVDGDGIVEWTATPSDGSAPQTITIAEPTVDTDTDTDTIITGRSVDAQGIVTYTVTDIDGNPLPDQTLDLSAMINTPQATLTSGSGITTVFDASTNTWTISSTASSPDAIQKCGGGDVDGSVVQCDQLDPEDFEVAADGTVSLKKKLAEIPVILLNRSNGMSTDSGIQTTMSTDFSTPKATVGGVDLYGVVGNIIQFDGRWATQGPFIDEELLDPSLSVTDLGAPNERVEWPEGDYVLSFRVSSGHPSDGGSVDIPFHIVADYASGKEIVNTDDLTVSVVTDDSTSSSVTGRVETAASRTWNYIPFTLTESAVIHITNGLPVFTPAPSGSSGSFIIDELIIMKM